MPLSPEFAFGSSEISKSAQRPVRAGGAPHSPPSLHALSPRRVFPPLSEERKQSANQWLTSNLPHSNTARAEYVEKNAHMLKKTRVYRSSDI